MVFQKSNLPERSQNVAYGLRIAGARRKDVLDAAVEKTSWVALWEEARERCRSGTTTAAVHRLPSPSSPR
jgi:ABC-type phosphate transport system ATPase subunit